MQPIRKAKAGSLKLRRRSAIQVVDLRPYRGELGTGAAQIEITGWFASLPMEGHQYNFLIKAATLFVGEPIDAPFMWEDLSPTSSLSLVLNQDFSRCGVHRSVAGGTTGAVSLPVPATAGFCHGF